ncbi:uncharacterized protein y4mH-like [Glandiceps talaboti]
MMEFIDPHFHIWDITGKSRTGQSADVLGGLGRAFPSYLVDDYLTDLSTVTGMTCKGCVWIECLSTIPLAEATWASTECMKLLDDSSIADYKIVARCDLSDEDVKKRLRRLGGVAEFVGVRHILNHHPSNPDKTYPMVEHGDYMGNEDWLNGYAILDDLGLTFDLQVNPHQLFDFVKVAQKYPNANVVIDHLGMLNEPSMVATWRAGMKALAKFPQVSVKLSMFDVIVPNWDKDAKARQEIRSYVSEIIELFGADRCMFASNFPVDKCSGHSMAELFASYREFVSHLDNKSQRDLFYGTAARVYKFDL